MGDTVDVIVIGAGLAGLAAACHLAAQGRSVTVVEASDAVGGRVRTDRHDGLLLDRGFQLLNPFYPEARRVLDLDALCLRQFAPGVALLLDGALKVVADPFRRPRDVLATVSLPGSPLVKVAAARYLLDVGYAPPARLRARVDRTVREDLARRGLGRSDDPVAGAIRVFLSGVLADTDGSSSARMTSFLMRSFVRGTPGLPEGGMQAIPEQLAARLPRGVLRLHTPARAVTGDRVQTDNGTMRAGAVIIATDPVAAQMLTGRARPTMRALTTYYYLIEARPDVADYLHVDPRREGPVVNSAAVSAVAPGYSPPGTTLIASTILGVGADSSEAAARRHTARLWSVPIPSSACVGAYSIPEALPAHPPGQLLRRRVDLGDGLFVAGDHRDTPSIQGALVSGRRAAEAALRHLAA